MISTAMPLVTPFHSSGWQQGALPSACLATTLVLLLLVKRPVFLSRCFLGASCEALAARCYTDGYAAFLVNEWGER
jgi:hypothetical protein